MDRCSNDRSRNGCARPEKHSGIRCLKFCKEALLQNGKAVSIYATGLNGEKDLHSRRFLPLNTTSCATPSVVNVGREISPSALASDHGFWRGSWAQIPSRPGIGDILTEQRVAGLQSSQADGEFPLLPSIRTPEKRDGRIVGRYGSERRSWGRFPTVRSWNSRMK